MFRCSLICVILIAIVFPSTGQLKTASQIKQATKEEFPQAINSFQSFLKIPNDGHYPDQIQANLVWIVDAFKNLDFKTQVIETPGAPHVYAEKQFVKKGKTVLFYLQIDGQPVDPSAWDQSSPFEATLKEEKNGKWEKVDWSRLTITYQPEWRIFARSSSDSKGPAMCFLSALSILGKHNVKPNFNIKVIMDFQEEMSSPQLEIRARFSTLNFDSGRNL